MSWRLAVAAFALVVAAGCRKPQPHWFERIEVEGRTVEENPLLGLDRVQVAELLGNRLVGAGGFRRVTADAQPSKDTPRARLSLELAFTREALKEGRPGTFAEVGAVLRIKQADEDYEVLGLGQVAITADSETERARLMREALGEAIDQVVDGAKVQLDAVDKPSAKLVEDLKAPDPRVRDSALTVLANRKDPAAVPVLISRLQSDEPGTVRRAIGQLVEIGDGSASPALIDLARGKDPSFLREILFALGALGGEDAEAYLFTVAQGHDQPAIRAVASEALSELTRRREKAGAAKETR